MKAWPVTIGGETNWLGVWMWDVTKGGPNSLSYATKSPTLWLQKRYLASPPLKVPSKIAFKFKPPSRPQTYLLQYANLRLSNMMPSWSCVSFRKPVELPVSQASCLTPAVGNASETTKAAAIAIASSGCCGALVMMRSVAAFPSCVKKNMEERRLGRKFLLGLETGKGGCRQT